MSSASQIVFYDIPTRDPKHCWSWNPWKTRLVLNFKGLDYVTEWTEYPDIKPKLEKHFPDETEHTSPAIRLPGGEAYVMDSRKIADRLEADHPNPSLHLDSPYIERIIQHLRVAMSPLQPVYIYLVPTRLLSEGSLPYFKSTREKGIGMPLEEIYQKHGGDAAWEKTKEGFSQITAMLQENEGPFFMGQTVSYADFIFAAVLLFFKTLGDDVYNKLVAVSGDNGQAFKKLLDGVEPWSKRDSY